MHYNSLHSCGKFVRRFLDPNKKLKILEVGSLDVDINPKKNMTFRRYFKNPNWEFVGLDIVPGKNVDVVSVEPYHYPFEDDSFDVVISGSTLEHVEDMHAWIKEIARVAKDLIWILVPNTCPEHKYPIDCWRVFPDGMRFLFEKVAGLKVITIVRNGRHQVDTIGVAKKYE